MLEVASGIRDTGHRAGFFVGDDMAAKKKAGQRAARKKTGKPANKPSTKRGRGRPSKFKAEYIRQAELLAEFGATDVQVAKFFGVTEKTVNNWKEQHPEFFTALKRGKQVSDDAVERSLFERATGYSHPEEKIFNHQGQIIRAETVKHYPPDTVAAIFWLKNRRPEEWRDKREIAGDPDNPIMVLAKAWSDDMDSVPD